MGKADKESEDRRLQVTFLHLDLGIGGAEQLIVNAAVALQKQGHTIDIFTSHHDTSHCFAETVGTGCLASCVHVHGDWLPRQILGCFTALCAVVRMLYLALMVGLSRRRRADVVFCDGVSAMIPVLTVLWAFPVVFYCHFPDKLLCTSRGSLIKRLYRWPLDWLEESTTGMATEIAVNSRFTAGVFKEAFTRIGPRFDPAIVYPAINLDSFVPPRAQGQDMTGPIVSINRFERKKNIGLALEAFARVRKELQAERESQFLRLVVAGGYDEAVTENREYMQELRAKAKDLKLDDSVVSFRPSISDEERASLLQDAMCVLYTPDKEHFGIVPLEAMYAGSPVIAVASGGPLETVVNEKTGFLCSGTADDFAKAILRLVNDPQAKRRMGDAGHEHVKQRFSLDAFAVNLDGVVRSAYAKGQAHRLKRRMAQLVWVVVVAVAVAFAARRS